MFKLKTDVIYSAFMDVVERCECDVIFKTTSGDVLNLKSKLSQFIFASAVSRPELLENGQIICADESDYERLSPYLMTTEE